MDRASDRDWRHRSSQAVWRRVVQADTLAPFLAFASCAPGHDLLLLPENPVRTYQLGAGDKVRIVTFGEEQLTGDVCVDGSGTIAMPLLSQVGAAGLTTNQLSGRISEQLVQRNALADRASIVRTEGNTSTEERVTRWALIQPGDVITIFERCL